MNRRADDRLRQVDTTAPPAPRDERVGVNRLMLALSVATLALQAYAWHRASIDRAHAEAEHAAAVAACTPGDAPATTTPDTWDRA